MERGREEIWRGREEEKRRRAREMFRVKEGRREVERMG